MSESALLWLCLTGLVSASAVLWLQYFDLKDSLRPEPRSRQFLAFGLGALSAVLALLVFFVLPEFGLPSGPGDSPGTIALFCFGLVGPIEEGAKFLMAWFVIRRWDVFDEEVDGLVYASAIALGFASVENLLHLPSMTLGEGALRALVSPLTHAVFASPWGFALARARIRSRGPGKLPPTWASRLTIPTAFAVSALAHGLYDYLLLAHQALPIAACVVALLWISLIARARRALRRDARRLVAEAGLENSRRTSAAAETLAATSGRLSKAARDQDSEANPPGRPGQASERAPGRRP